METQSKPEGSSGAPGAAVGDGRAPGKAVEQFIDKIEVARRLNKNQRTVDNWMKRGLLPYYKIGRTVTFRWSEVEAYLAQTCRVARRSLPAASPSPLANRTA